MFYCRQVGIHSVYNVTKHGHRFLYHYTKKINVSKNVHHIFTAAHGKLCKLNEISKKLEANIC